VNAIFAKLLARHYNVLPLVRCAVLSHPCHYIQGFHLSPTLDWSKSKEITVCTQMQDKVFFPLNLVLIYARLSKFAYEVPNQTACFEPNHAEPYQGLHHQIMFKQKGEHSRSEVK